ncbi:hypothetical protein [Mycoplasmopsis cynos]|nr:hypothetical protein [Mycoplasmopsis cynos]UWV77080.1 hypothetical protein NW070_04850 [Mycoplasmopsis cynos]UWV82052.1 hypothetical protein NW065_03205 [Mycoplasmopsis cynos]UWV92819.1 hypothetical protein NWE57_01980 [Mycoplasmopsis cynos]WAM04773.1 hypothetical protein ONA01_00850 [Mycoplasmopsis cynos]WAM08277.1 hypothetical protein ONA21_03260 [Mycoplasmopsis cynos]
MKYISFKYNGEKYLSFSKMWALERGLDILISSVAKLAFLYKKSGSFF